jgi:hypothetical protein
MNALQDFSGALVIISEGAILRFGVKGGRIGLRNSAV